MPSASGLGDAPESATDSASGGACRSGDTRSQPPDGRVVPSEHAGLKQLFLCGTQVGSSAGGTAIRSVAPDLRQPDGSWALARRFAFAPFKPSLPGASALLSSKSREGSRTAA